MRCQKCQFWCDGQDAFCRKCGGPLASEAIFVEQSAPAQVVVGEQVGTVETLEVAPVTIEMSNPSAIAISSSPDSALARPTPKTDLKSRVLGLATRTLGSEEGRAIVKGAAVLAVSVGLELLNRARQSPAPPTSTALTRPPQLDKLADIANLVEPLGPLAPGTTVVETWSYRYSYTRRITRRVK